MTRGRFGDLPRAKWEPAKRYVSQVDLVQRGALGRDPTPRARCAPKAVSRLAGARGSARKCSLRQRATAARLQELGRAQPGTPLAPPGGARPGKTSATHGARSGWRHTRPYRRAGRDRRRPATRICARRAGPATRRPVPCKRAYAAEPRRSSSELDDLWRRFRCRGAAEAMCRRWFESGLMGPLRAA